MSIDHLFYDTHLGKTAPEDLVTRTEHEIFQVDEIESILEITSKCYDCYL